MYGTFELSAAGRAPTQKAVELMGAVPTDSDPRLLGLACSHDEP